MLAAWRAHLQADKPAIGRLKLYIALCPGANFSVGQRVFVSNRAGTVLASL